MDSALSQNDYEAIYNLSQELGRKFDVGDLIHGEYRGSLDEIASEFIRTYTGKFEFLQDVALSYRRKGELTAAQAKGVLNCIVAEQRRNLEREALQKRTESAETLPEGGTKAIPDGRFTLVYPNGHYRTFRIKTLDDNGLERYDKPKGTRLLMFMNGPDNESNYQGFAWITPEGSLRIWSRFRQDGNLYQDAINFLALDSNGAKSAAEAYAVRSGNCAICGRTLTVPTSISRGIGPECAAKLGW